jgi:hypothetical protein
MPYIKLFSNGTEADIWIERNCERCWRTQDDDPNAMPSCPIYAAITVGYISGAVSDEIAKRAGYDRRWPATCAEFSTIDPDRHKRDMERLAAWNSGQPIKAVE